MICAREINGQVFIVTRGGQSIKLGLVEVFAFERGDVEKTIREVDRKMKNERENIADLQRTVEAAYKQAKEGQDAAFEQELKHIENHDLQTRYETASRLTYELIAFKASVASRLNYVNSSTSYFAAFPQPVAKAKTDADGNFSIRLPMLGSFLIGATAKRLAGDKTEYYAWLVSTDPDGMQKLTLSNDNLTSERGSNSVLYAPGEQGWPDTSSASELREQYNKIAQQYGLHQAEVPPRFIILTKAISIALPSGSITVPVGTKLQLISQDGANVRIRHPAGDQIIPIVATDLPQ